VTGPGRTVHDLVPAFQRHLDSPEVGGDGLLATLLDVIARGSQDLEEHLLRELDDRFVETCGEDELSHFAALLGVRELPGRRARRALIADVTAYRRRKGTIASLEDVARTATGWTAKATEYFPLLAGTFNVNHVRPGHVDAVSVRDPVLAHRVGTPYDPNAHGVDVREVRHAQGRYNLPNVAIDLWRLEPVPEHRRPLVAVDATDPHRFRLHPLGLDLPLWSKGDPEPSIEHRVGVGDTTEAITMAEAWADWGRFYGPGRSICLYEGDVAVDRADVTVCDLGDTATGWGNPSPPTPYGLDPVRGRLVVTGSVPADLTASWHRALPLPLGGGGYPREVRAVPQGTQVRTVGAIGADATDLATALASFPADATSRHVWLVDSSRHSLPGAVTVPAGSTLVLSAAQGRWPVLEGGLDVAAGVGSRVGLDGLAVTGGPVRVTGSPARVWVNHCTLAGPTAPAPGGRPGTGSDEPALVLDLDATADTEVRLAGCVSGPVVGAADRSRLSLADSVVVAGPGPDSGASDVSVLVGSALAPFPGLPEPPALSVRLGAATMVDVVLAGVPTSVAQAASLLDTALSAALAGTDPGRPAVQAVAAGDRLLLVGADLLGVAVGPHSGGADGGAALGLRTDPAGAAYRAVGRLSGTLGTPAALAGLSGALPLVVWDGGSPAPAVDVAVPALGATLDAVAVVLSSALATSPDAGATAVSVGARLLLLPGAAGRSLQPGPSELTSKLRLGRQLPRVGGSPDGLQSGPPLVLDRSTLLGDALVRSAEVSDSIVLGRLVAARRQSGCVRYSWTGAGSLTPRRFRSGGAPTDPVPTFVATGLGQPGLGQLTPCCPALVTEGAESGAEMGVFHDVGQPERLAAAQSLLAEYLRFTAEAGIFLAS
jgi:hypothetical protein